MIRETGNRIPVQRYPPRDDIPTRLSELMIPTVDDIHEISVRSWSTGLTTNIANILGSPILLGEMSRWFQGRYRHEPASNAKRRPSGVKRVANRVESPERIRRPPIAVVDLSDRARTPFDPKVGYLLVIANAHTTRDLADAADRALDRAPHLEGHLFAWKLGNCLYVLSYGRATSSRDCRAIKYGGLGRSYIQSLEVVP